jgi:hypothetical protein
MADHSLEAKTKSPASVLDVFNHGDDISAAAALKICSDHLKGDWSNIGVDSFKLSVIQ